MRNFSGAAIHSAVEEIDLTPDYPVNPKLKSDIMEFFDSVRDMDVEDSFTDDGIERVKKAFIKFLTEQRCWNALHSFEELCKEKSGDNSYRGDDETPNILHEIRNCAHQLGYIVRGYMPPDEYFHEGGLDADLMSRIRHDSIEDHGKTQFSIFAKAEEYLHKLQISAQEFQLKIHQAVKGAEASDLQSRKHAKVNKHGHIERDSKTGKIIKEERYDGDTGVYFAVLRKKILSLLGKYDDRTENVTTRWGVKRFTAKSNRKYARQTREIYGLEAYDEEAIRMWPEFKAAIICRDAMLGLGVRCLEGMNKYKSNKALNPDNGMPFRLIRELPAALIPYQDLPAIFHPISVNVHMFEREVKKDPRVRKVINNLMLAPIIQSAAEHVLKPIPGITLSVTMNDTKPDIVINGGGLSGLPTGAARAPMVS